MTPPSYCYSPHPTRPGSPCSRGFLHRVSVSLALSDLKVLILALQTSGMCACRAIVLVLDVVVARLTVACDMHVCAEVQAQ